MACCLGRSPARTNRTIDMKGIRFYLEFTDRSKQRSEGNIIAALAINGAYWSDGRICYEAIAAVFHFPDSPVAGTGVALDYLRVRCKRVSEMEARLVHPTLFRRLEED